MKRFDDNTKKLIKNVVSLIASALVLVAATVAWFNIGGDAETKAFRGSLQRVNSELAFFRLTTVEDALTGVTTGTGSSAAFIYSSETQPTISDRTPLSIWTATTGAGSWNISSLIPGSYDGFRIDISGNAALRLIIDGITCTDLNNQRLSTEQLTTVYQNVYLYAVALQTTIDDTTNPETRSYDVMKDLGGEDVIVCDSLYNLLNGNVAATTLTTLTTADPAQSTSGNKTVLLFIGVPGSTVTVPSGQTAPDLVTEHDALRQIGAKLSFGSFAVEAG